MQVSRKTSRKVSSKRNRAPHNFSNPFKLKVVKLHLEEGIPQSIVASECNIATSSVYRWVKLYEELGESGLYRGNRNLVSQKKIHLICGGHGKEKILLFLEYLKKV